MIGSNEFRVSKKLLFSFICVFVLFVFSSAQNAIVTENSLPGNPISEWGVPNFRDNRIAGFATKISLNAGETVRFKINVQSGVTYNLRIYRIGYYAGNGARLLQDFGTLSGTVQPAGISDASTGMLDCSNWSESASWAIPSGAVSGLYIARLERTGGGSNHIIFIVRNDASNSDLYLQFPDATWQAYNGYGGNSMYDGSTSWPAGHAVKTSYNRPFFPYNSLFNTDGRQADWYMNATYPMIRWLERNGYNITYTSCNDVARNGSRLLNHKVFISIGHDEYISKQQRANIEAARNAGVHLAFFSGNEFYWKTRWENNDGMEDRTLVCYKEGFMGDGSLGERSCGYKCDPSSEWTGLWRTGGNYDAGTPENGLTGQVSWVEYPAQITVPALYKKIRLWRNTSVANLSSGQTAALGVNTLGYEWDYEQSQYSSNYPPGRFTASSTTISGKTHKLSLYRHSSGALVFGAGTVQWSWGLDGAHWGGSTTTSTEMQQATVNLFADMGSLPGSLQSGLTQASQSTDFTGPSASFASPSNGATFSSGATVNFSGSSNDGGGGVVTSVEISTNGGSTWTPATINSIDGSITWSYSWTGGANGAHTIQVRGIDDSGNFGDITSIAIIIGSGGDVTPPTVSSVLPTNGATGVSGTATVSAIFSEAINSSTVTNTTFRLRDAGNNLVSATVSTSGSQITLTPSSALSGFTTYTATITGGASGVKDLFGNALSNNYVWSFTTAAGPDNSPPTVTSVSPLNGVTGVNIFTAVAANFNEDLNASTVTNATFQLRDAGNNPVNATVSVASDQITLTPTAPLTISSSYTVTIVGGASGIKDLAGNAMASDYSWSFTTGNETSPPPTPLTIHSFNTKTGTAATLHSLTGVPAGALLVLTTTADVATTNCSVSSAPSLTWTKRSDAGATNSDNAEIWTAVFNAGGSITVTSNWGAGKSQASVCYVVLNAEASLNGAFATAVLQSAPSVTINTTRQNSIIFGCSADWNAINGSTRILRDAATERLYFKDGNYTTYHYSKGTAAIAAYTEGVSLPTGQQSSTALLEIRGVEVVADNTPPTVSSVAPVNGATNVPVSTTVSIIFNEAMDAGTINSSTIELRNSSNVVIAAAVSYNAATKTATLTPSGVLANAHVHSAKVLGGTTGVKDVAGNALATDYNWSFTTEAGDITPPTVSTVAPVNGATGVPVSTAISIIFNEAMDVTAINSSTIELRNSSNVLITATVSYNAGTRTATVTPTAALANSQVYSAKVKSGTTGVKDLAGNALASDYDWSFTTEAGDITPPSVISVTPVNGTTGVSINATITASFSEAINSSTVTGTTFQMRDAGNNPVSATLNTASNQITLTPAAPLTASTTYTVTIVGGASGVKDLAGNALGSNYTWNFTSAGSSGGGTTYTVFQSSNTPAVPLANDGQGIELGMRFRSTQDGFINGIRYYKGAGAGGTHTGSLWSNTGTRLAQATFTGETSSGWQQVLFGSPIPITAGVTYVATYFSPSGDYASTKPYFTQNIVNGPLIGLADGTDGPNGLYRYTATSAFPTSSFQSSNYWVDVIFTLGSGPDVTPPSVTSVSPLSGATGVSIGTTVIANFNEPISGASVTVTTFQLRDAGNNLISATVTTSGSQIRLTPSAALSGSTVYTATVVGGGSGVKDLAGNALASNYTWSFTTAGVDILPPTVTSVSPLNGATGVSVTADIVANFSEAINASTVTGTTFQLRDAGNNLVSAVVSTTGNQITLNPSASLATSTTYTATITGGASGVKDLAGNALASNYTWSFTTASVDIIPPTVTSVSPLSGATGVGVTADVIANFSEAVNASTVTGTTFQLRDAGNNLVSAVVSTTGNQITLNPSASLAATTTYTATITGGASGVKDLAGNALASNYSWSFTTAAGGGGGSTYTVFQPTDLPVEPTNNDGQGIVLGMKFRSTQDGFITGVRYYKGAGTTGTHTGHLWSSAGTLLGSTTFSGETASGWQQTLFSAPIAIIANTTYIVSLFSPSGDYAANAPYFTQPVVNGPLRALANGEDGPNALYRYSSTSVFPNNSYNSSNYWVDVVFSTTGGGGTGSRPAGPVITSVKPSNSRPPMSSLGQNFPNPFNGVTMIPFTLSIAEKVNLVLFDINGRVVKTFVNTSQAAGSHVVSFNAGSLASGIYYYKLQAGDFTEVRKLIIR